MCGYMTAQVRVSVCGLGLLLPGLNGGPVMTAPLKAACANA